MMTLVDSPNSKFLFHSQEIPTVDNFLKEFSKHNYKLLADGSINLVGWRVKSPYFTNKFCDYFSVYSRSPNGGWQGKIWACTTRPGITHVKKPQNRKGVAILAPGQYHNAYALGPYKGYLALKQVRSVSVLRDSSKDEIINPTGVETGFFGIHIHKAGVLSNLVNNWSAGCQVFKSASDFKELITMCESEALRNGNRFTYTLLEF